MAMVRARGAYDEGTVIVAASGNECQRATEVFVSVSMPGAAEGMVSVGAVGEKAGRFEAADFSNTWAEVCALGVRIISGTRSQTKLSTRKAGFFRCRPMPNRTPRMNEGTSVCRSQI